MSNVTNSTIIDNIVFLLHNSTVVTTVVPAGTSTVVSQTVTPVVPTKVSTVVTAMLPTSVVPTLAPTMVPKMTPTVVTTMISTPVVHVPTMVPTMVPTIPPTVVPPVVTVGTIIPLFWTSSGPDVYYYIVTWERDTSGECPDVDSGNATISGSSTFYIIQNVEENSRYFIVVKAIGSGGSAISLMVAGTTFEAGE